MIAKAIYNKILWTFLWYNKSTIITYYDIKYFRKNYQFDQKKI